MKLFYLNGNKISAAVREHRRKKGLRRGPMSTNGLKKMMKFENAGDFGVAGGGRWPFPMEVVDEVAMAAADRAEWAPNSATSARAFCWHVNLVSQGQQLEKFFAVLYTGISARFRLCSNWNPMIRSNVLILPFSFWHEWKWMTCSQRIFCGLTSHILLWKVQWICRPVEHGVQLNRS